VRHGVNYRAAQGRDAADAIALNPDSGLTSDRARALPGGSVEIVYDVSGRASDVPGRDPGWSPASRQPNA
jgi:hypothetical protein